VLNEEERGRSEVREYGKSVVPLGKMLSQDTQRESFPEKVITSEILQVN